MATCSYSEVLTPNINPTFSKTYNPRLNLPIKSQFSRDFEEQLSSSYESVIIYVIECAEVLVQICLELVLLTLKGSSRHSSELEHTFNKATALPTQQDYPLLYIHKRTYYTKMIFLCLV